MVVRALTSHHQSPISISMLSVPLGVQNIECRRGKSVKKLLRWLKVLVSSVNTLSGEAEHSCQRFKFPILYRQAPILPLLSAVPVHVSVASSKSWKGPAQSRPDNVRI